MESSMRFENKILFVTGGASGIGRATAARVVAEGGRAAIVDLDLAKAQAIAAELPGCIGLSANVADEEQVRAAVEATVAQLGGIDIVLAAAGHAEFGPLSEWDSARFNKMMEVHIGGTFLTAKYTTPVMKSRGGGAIVNIASVAGIVAQKINVPYGAAKAAISGFTRQFALEAAPEVRVNCVAPGRVQTGMTEPLMMSRGGSLEKGAEMFGQANMLKRMATADELASVICFLLSNDASFITGETIVADGGEVFQ
jgi:NAD(P)-dependent dehydrogenase (short-subunit alcohol dehydrogenase family)